MNRIKRSTYLSHVASARALFREMFKEAQEALAPIDLASGTEAIECFATHAKLAKTLGVSRSTVAKDLRLLENMKWVRVGQSPRFLGQRCDGECFLLADEAAYNATQEERVVSRLVLYDLIEKKQRVEDKAQQPGRGGARRWRGGADAASA